MTKRRLTPEQIACAIELRERGWSCQRIARKVGCSDGAVYWHCLVNGADSPRARPIDKTIRGPIEVRRGNHTVRRFTPAEDEQLVRLELAGSSLTDIARQLGRRWNSVRGRLMTLARHEARAELNSAPEAQLDEQQPSKLSVVGSSPTGRTTLTSGGTRP